MNKKEEMESKSKRREDGQLDSIWLINFEVVPDKLYWKNALFSVKTFELNLKKRMPKYIKWQDQTLKKTLFLTNLLQTNLFEVYHVVPLENVKI